MYKILFHIDLWYIILETREVDEKWRDLEIGIDFWSPHL